MVPGGYDQVITVGAINDYDGTGWGEGRRPGSCSGGADDVYAGYSNVGRDVDILAPGTCVRSTMPDPGRAQPGERGTFTQAMTGTSQATPHVAGAVARYLAAQPGTSPEQMRRIVRAAGRLDWDIGSDPLWSGVDDGDSPGRILDTAALLGPADVSVWLSHDRFRVAGSSTRRQARVDVQRGGAYAGPLELSVADLPASVGSAVFDRPGVSLDGLAGLGARLRLTLPVAGDQGSHSVTVLASGSGGSPAGGRTLDLLVDRKGPRVSGLVARIRGGDSPLDAGGRVPAVVSWSVQDAWSQVAQVTAQHRLGTRRWRKLDSAMNHARVSVAPGHPQRVRVRATDDLGNGTTSGTLPVRLTVRDSSSPAVVAPAGGWSSVAVAAARGGSLLVADATASSLVTDFHGTSVGLLAPIAPQRGRLRLRIDGGPWQEVDLRAPRSLQQRIVHARSVPAGDHRLEVQRVRGLVALDAILILD